jgi:hypothetical protein
LFDLDLSWPAISFCYGDGSETPCPCGNTGGAGEGCANSSGAGGRLTATGSALVAADKLLFEVQQLPASQSALLLSALTTSASGSGTPFGSGLRRLSGNVIGRLGVKPTDNTGCASWGPDLAVTTGWIAGKTHYFQYWYREPAGSPCLTRSNLTSAIMLTFE